jgi:hypothetical protein
MSEGVAILVPALARSQNVAPLLASIRESTPQPYRVLWLLDPGDRAEQDAVAAAGGWMLSAGGSYAAKINAGVRATDEPLVFLAADDLRFRPCWLDIARAAIGRGAHVVGVNDGIRRRRVHATHFLLTREYAQRPCIDGTPGPLSVAYDHSFVDDELIATATKRGVYVHETRSTVLHLHPDMRSAPDDDTYRKGRAKFESDRAVFNERSALWT